MAVIDTVSFKCTCGKRLQARMDQVGRVFKCPSCGDAITIPSLQVETVGPTRTSDGRPLGTPEPPASLSFAGKFFSTIPTSVGELTVLILISWTAVGLFTLFLLLFGLWGKIVGVSLMFLFSVGATQQLWILLRARQTVLKTKRVSLLWGMIDLVAWEPTEGVLILKNKGVHFSDDNLEDGIGGVRFVYPVLGEELALRVPLETQTLSFSDHNVLTKEYLHLSVRGAMKWRIVDIRKFYLLVSRELRSTSEKPGGASVITPSVSFTDEARTATARLIDATIEWLRATAEEQTRIVVSRVRSGLLIADRLASELPELRGSGGDSVGDSTHGLAGNIHDVVASSLERYGIAVDDVALHEVKLPDEIIQQCVEACRTAYLPLIATRQASVRKAELAAEVELLGRETIGTREVVSNAPAYALGDFLSAFVAKRVDVNAATSGIPAIAASVVAKSLESSLPASSDEPR